jgi:A/G-specific adenine glycosylase
MDLGATVCTPKRPACGVCPLVRDCAGRRAGIAAELPRKVARAAKPVRFGVAYLAVRDDAAVLVETRPATGLLGGMLGLPGSDWVAGTPAARPPLAAAWRDLGVEVRHSFTHFHLRLRLEGARVPAGAGDFRPAEAAGAAMPTVMRKALRLGLAAMADRAGGA